MRKLGFVLMALLAMSLVAVNAQAQAKTGGTDMKGQFCIGVDGGLGLPTGTLAKSIDWNEPVTNDGLTGADMKMGYDFGVFVDYYVMPQFAVGAHFGYVANNMKDQTVEGVTYKDLLKAKTMIYGIHGKYMIPTGGGVQPYLGVGVSGYNRKFDLSTEFQQGFDVTESSFSDNKFGIDGMVGVDYAVGPMFSVGVNGAYHSPFGKFEHDFGGDVGKQTIIKDWMFMTFNAAITYHVPMGKK
jgi:opacity protein-like surface antigen